MADRVKLSVYNKLPGDRTCEPLILSMETPHGTHGEDAVELIEHLAQHAHKENLTESKEAFIDMAREQLSVALRTGITQMCLCYHECLAQRGDGRLGQ